MKKEIKVASLEITPVQDLAIQAACAYYEMEKDRLLSKAKNAEHARRKSLVYFLLRKECQMTDGDIGDLCGTSRQNVSYQIGKIDIRKGLYLQNTCDYRNIAAIFSHLLEEQKKWLEAHHHSQ